jgi:hypothetical protein
MKLWLRRKRTRAERWQGNLLGKRQFEYRTGNATVILESTCEVDETASVSQALVSIITTHLPSNHWDNITGFRYTNIE